VEPKYARLQTAARRWDLTPKQGEVLGLLAHGLSNRAIAAALCCSQNTVELHVTALLRKSHCKGRAALVARYWTDV
jgi:DNA-binding NarL/FixJ family response regulator